MKKYPDKIKSLLEGRRASTVIENDYTTRRTKVNCLNDSGAKQEKVDFKRSSVENETYRICQAILLFGSVFTLSYHGIRHGRTEYSFLENGRIVQGYVHKAVVTLSFGYSVPYSVVSFVAAGMLVYSLISKRPRWSLPSIILYLTDLVCDVSDAIVAIWLFFSSYAISTALLYAIGALFLITGEVWVWLGVLRLYEHRTFT